MENVARKQEVSPPVGLSLTHKCTSLSVTRQHSKHNLTDIYRRPDEGRNSLDEVEDRVRYFGASFAQCGTYVKLEREDSSVAS